MILLDFEFTVDERAYLHDQLNRVARTFALLPQFLDMTLGSIMTTAYLVCRVVDNIEDCDQPFAWKQARFNEVRSLLHTPERKEEVLGVWTQLDWLGLTPDETALMRVEKGQMLWEIYSQIPDQYRTVICRWANEMANGMENTLNPAVAPRVISEGNLLILSELEDYNTYCYYVAGTVGHLQTELLQAYYHFSDEVFDALRKYSVSFGLGLQKTNIIKDFLEDLNRGMVYIPYAWLIEIQKSPLSAEGATLNWIKHVLMDVKGVLDEAVEYISSLPYKVRGVRQTTLMCLLPAYQTILLAADRSKMLFTNKHHIKISKQVLATCFEDAISFSADNQLLKQHRDQMHEQIKMLLGESQHLSTKTIKPSNV